MRRGDLLRRALLVFSVLGGVALLACVLGPNAHPSGVANTPRIHSPLAPVVPLGSVPSSDRPRAVVSSTFASPAPGARSVGSGPINAHWFHPQLIYSQSDPATLLFGEGAGLAVDNVLGNMTAFGGLASGGLSNLSYYYGNWTASAWFYTNSSVFPSPRDNMTFATYQPDDVAVLFGGLTNLRTQVCTNETWLYWFANQTFENITGGPAPPPRESAAFAVDQAKGIGVLQGGWDPAYSQGGSSASVIWNDTWAFNFTTHTWSRLNLTTAPVPRFAESMIWDPLNATFYLFGGCSTLCSNDVWSWKVGAAGWSLLVTSGAPTARGGASVVWDPYDQTVLLFGGFNWGPNGPSALGETYQFDPTYRMWYDLQAAGSIPAAYDSPAVFADYPGCIGFWVQGGSGALAGVVQNISFLVPAGIPYPDCTDRPGSGPGPPPPPICKGNATPVSVRTVDSVTGAPLPNAAINITGYCSMESGVTDSLGFFNVTMPAPDNLSVSATHSGYHPFRGISSLVSTVPDLLTLQLVALPVACVHVVGEDVAGAQSPLAGASVTLSGTTVIGLTGSTGWANATVPFGTGLFVTASATEVGYSTDTRTVPVPWTGRFVVNLTLLAAGAFDIHVVAGASDRSLGGAWGTILSVGPGGFPPINFRAGSTGWYNGSLPAGNFSVTANAVGYGPNTTSATIVHPWRNLTVVLMRLSIEYGANLTVVVRDARTTGEIAGATVVVGGERTQRTALGGATVFVDVVPPGEYFVRANASGYEANSTLVNLPYLAAVRVEISLSPIPPCTVTHSCPSSSSNVPPIGPSLWLPQGETLALVLLAPAVLYASAVVFLVARDRTGRRTSGTSTRQSASTSRPAPYSETSRGGAPR